MRLLNLLMASATGSNRDSKSHCSLMCSVPRSKSFISASDFLVLYIAVKNIIDWGGLESGNRHCHLEQRERQKVGIMLERKDKKKGLPKREKNNKFCLMRDCVETRNCIQCDLIGQNFTALAKLKKLWLIFEGLFRTWQYLYELWQNLHVLW